MDILKVTFTLICQFGGWALGPASNKNTWPKALSTFIMIKDFATCESDNAAG